MSDRERKLKLEHCQMRLTELAAGILIRPGPIAHLHGSIHRGIIFALVWNSSLRGACRKSRFGLDDWRR